MKCCFWASEESLEAIGTSPTFKLSPAKQVEFLGNRRYVNKDCSLPPSLSDHLFLHTPWKDEWLYRADQEDESLIKKVAWTC